MPAHSLESQPSEAWPASIYGHLRQKADLGVSVIKDFSFFVHIILFFKELNINNLYLLSELVKVNVD